MLPRLFMLEEEYRIAALASEFEFTAGLIDDLATGRLTWNLADMQKLVAESGEAELEMVRKAVLAAQGDSTDGEAD
jgi:hypothetical protein